MNGGTARFKFHAVFAGSMRYCEIKLSNGLAPF